jgi:hypothetical protein
VLAVEGNGRNVSPKVVIEMSHQQLERTSLAERDAYLARILRPGQSAEGRAWLAPNSRKGIRDEALRALKRVGAVVELDLPSTSSKPRYALAESFAQLFDPALMGEDRGTALATWREGHLGGAELARLAIVAAQARDTVRLPDGTTQALTPGPSAAIMAGLIEQFAPRFLEEPAVLGYSDPRGPITYLNERLMSDLGLVLEAGDPLPDVLLADLARPLRFAFAEAVATEGPVDLGRVEAVRRWLERCGFDLGDAYFVTAYLDRGQAAFRRTVGEIAWRSVVWFVAEPERLLIASDAEANRAQRRRRSSRKRRAAPTSGPCGT